MGNFNSNNPYNNISFKFVMLVISALLIHFILFRTERIIENKRNGHPYQKQNYNYTLSICPSVHDRIPNTQPSLLMDIIVLVKSKANL